MGYQWDFSGVWQQRALLLEGLLGTAQLHTQSRAVPGAPALRITPSRGLGSLGASPSIARWFQVY